MNWWSLTKTSRLPTGRQTTPFLDLFSLAVLAGTALSCGCDGDANTTKPAPQTYHIKGRVFDERDAAHVSGLVALLAPGSIGSQLNNSRQGLAESPSAAKPWPCGPFQRAIAGLQKTRVSSATVTDRSGAFVFPVQVGPGSYVVSVGVPLLYDPGVKSELPRDWPQQLSTEMRVTLADEEFIFPARGAWFLEFRVVDSDGELNLRSTEFVTWPTNEPTNEQTNTLGMALRNADPIRQKVLRLETQVANAEAKARLSRQPLHVKELRKLAADATKEQNLLEESKKALMDTFGRIFPSAEVRPHRE